MMGAVVCSGGIFPVQTGTNAPKQQMQYSPMEDSEDQFVPKTTRKFDSVPKPVPVGDEEDSESSG